MKKTGLFLLAVIAILLIVLITRSLSLKSKQIAPTGTKTDVSQIEGAIERISKSITYKTISFDDTALIDYTQFLAFHEFLRASYPVVFSACREEMVNTYTMVLEWTGKDTTLPPGIFMAHQDVVPVSDDTKDMWTVPPFEGLIRDGILYGRGAIDDKINLMAQLETTEFLIKAGFQPERTIYFVFGHDEEIGGEQGAKKVAELFEQRNIRAFFVLDEGGIITNEKVPGMTKPVALIGTAEKGWLNLELTVDIPGGHSSMPEKATAVDVMAKALTDLRAHPFPPSITPSVQDFLDHVAPEMPFTNKLVMSNLWLFKPLLYKIYGSSATGDAMIRTTMVPTIINGGVKSNIIPTVVKTTVNYRLLPGTSVQEAIRHTEKAINNPKVQIRVIPIAKEATTSASTDSLAFQQLMSPLKHHFDDVVVAPFLMIGGTDSRHFQNVTPNIYKFSPMIDPIGFHGVNEQLKVAEYQQAIGFYVDFIKKL